MQHEEYFFNMCNSYYEVLNKNQVSHKATEEIKEIFNNYDMLKSIGNNICRNLKCSCRNFRELETEGDNFIFIGKVIDNYLKNRK